MTDTLNEADKVGRISQLGSSSTDDINNIWNPRELFVNTTTWEIAVHDGVTPGGHWLAKRDMSNINGTDIAAKLENINPNKIWMPNYDCCFMSVTAGNDTNSGLNPLVPVQTLGRAIATGKGTIVCLDSSTITLDNISDRTLYAPYSVLVFSNNITISNSIVIAKELTRQASSTLSLTNESYVKIYKGNNLYDCITVSAGTIFSAVNATSTINAFTRLSVGSIIVKDWNNNLMMNYTDSTTMAINGNFECNGGTYQWEPKFNPIIAQMELYTNSGGTAGVRTKTYAETNNGTILGDYFIHDVGSDNFKMPKMPSAYYQRPVPSYDNRIYDSNLPTSDVSWGVDAIAQAFVRCGGGNWSYINYIITTPDGNSVIKPFYEGHGNGVSSCNSQSIYVPAGHKLRFSISGAAPENQNLVVFRAGIVTLYNWWATLRLHA